ncbi:MAG: hypothetical protein AAFR87_23135 [Bacteroidota bacterium]
MFLLLFKYKGKCFLFRLSGLSSFSLDEKEAKNQAAAQPTRNPAPAPDAAARPCRRLDVNFEMRRINGLQGIPIFRQKKGNVACGKGFIKSQTVCVMLS